MTTVFVSKKPLNYNKSRLLVRVAGFTFYSVLSQRSGLSSVRPQVGLLNLLSFDAVTL